MKERKDSKERERDQEDGSRETRVARERGGIQKSEER